MEPGGIYSRNLKCLQSFTHNSFNIVQIKKVFYDITKVKCFISALCEVKFDTVLDIIFVHRIIKCISQCTSIIMVRSGPKYRIQKVM